MDGYHAALNEWDKISGELKFKAKAEEIMDSDPEILDLIGLNYQKRVQWAKEYPNKTSDEAREIEAALELYWRTHVETPAEKTVQAHIDSFIKLPPRPPEEWLY